MCEFFLWPQSGMNLQQQKNWIFAFLGANVLKGKRI